MLDVLGMFDLFMSFGHRHLPAGSRSGRRCRERRLPRKGISALPRSEIPAGIVGVPDLVAVSRQERPLSRRLP
jgi:hypothetical protein